MDQTKGPQMDSIAASATLKKKRSQTSRRPKPEGQSLPDHSALPSKQVVDTSSDEIVDEDSSRRMLNLDQCFSPSFPVESVQYNGSGDGNGTENRLKKVKLKVGGVTRTIQTKLYPNGASTSGLQEKGCQPTDNGQQTQRLIYQGESDEYHSAQMDKKSGLQGIPWKDFASEIGRGRENSGRASRNGVENKVDKSDAVRKSRRVRKRQMDQDFDEDVEDDEIRYLEKLKTSKMSGSKDVEVQPSRKVQKVGKSETAEAKKTRGEEASFSSSGENKKPKMDLPELQTENKKEVALTSRQRALLSKDPSSAAGASQIEFPDGLQPAPSRKRKVKLSEEEQQSKKAEAAQRRKMLNEIAARETEAEAIRKILGQDSSRKKKEDKIKKRLDELAQEKMANALLLASSTIRTVMGPDGTTVTFPLEMGFPKIFDPNPPRYPPPREMCAGPSCRNPYKYRDSKSKLPLCSLQCYKAVHESMGPGKAC